MGRSKEPKRLLSEEHRHLIALLRTLGARTGKSTQGAQAAALGVSDRTWSNWLNGTLPASSNFDDLLARAKLTVEERTVYQRAWQAVRDNPSVTLPRPVSKTASAPVGLDQLAAEPPPAPAEERSGEGVATAVTVGPLSAETTVAAMPGGAGEDEHPDGRWSGPSDGQAPEGLPVTLDESKGPSPAKSAPEDGRPGGKGIGRGLSMLVGATALLVLLIGVLVDPLGLRSSAESSLPGVPSTDRASGPADSASTQPAPTPVDTPCDRYIVTADDMKLRTEDNVPTDRVLQRGEIAVVLRHGTRKRTQLWYVTANGKTGWILADRRYWKPYC